MTTGGGGGGSPASPANSVQFNNGGAFGGSANFTFDGAAITATGGYYLPTYTRAGSPSCGVTWLSKEIRVHDAGTADETWVCEIDYVGGYNWASYSQVSPAADGALAVVTVGAVFTDTPSGGFCIPSIVSTQAGAAVSGGCQRIVAGGCNTIPASNLYYKQGMMYLAVGYTAQFNRVHLEFGGKPWPMNVVEMHGPLAVPPWTANYPTGHRVYMQGGGPYPLGMWPVGWVTGGSSPQNLSGTRYGTYGTVSGTRQLQGPYAIYYQSNQFTRSGDLKWALSAAQRAAWTMGWNATLGPTPSGVTVGNYYWVLFTYDGGYSTPWTRNTPWEHCTDSVWDPEAISPTTSHFSVLATEVYDD
jgi:hypothetical protein